MEEAAQIRVPTPPLPPEAVPLRMQVSGHFYGKKETKLGMLELNDGTLIKPLIPTKGDKELIFYSSVFQPSDGITKDIEALRPLLPKFWGVWKTALHPGIKYLKLENVTKRFTKPCILDVKVGLRTWQPGASKEKRDREIQKYPPQLQVGFRLLGLNVYKMKTNSYLQLDAVYMRSLQPSDILPKGILVYLNLDENITYKKGILTALIKKLNKIKDWFSVQTTYHFYASSLLFVYEGYVKDVIITEDSDQVNYDDLVDIRIIDFTHVFPACGQKDDNFLTGVTKLLEKFEAALEYCLSKLNVSS